MAHSIKFAALAQLVAPPPHPLRNAAEGNWTRLLTVVDFPFPTEFLHYGRLYGTGEIEAAGYGLLVANPLDPAYPRWLRRKSEFMRTVGDPPELSQTRYYPEPRGVVPFAENWSGDLLFLARNRTAAQVATCPTGDPNELVMYPLGFAGFLHALFAGNLEPEYFPNRELRKRKPVFKKRAWLK
jgi:hypothetical protein